MVVLCYYNLFDGKLNSPETSDSASPEKITLMSIRVCILCKCNI